MGQRVVPRYQNPLDQILTAGILESRIKRTTEGTINASAMTAVFIDNEWHYFSHRKPISELGEASRADIEADFLILGFDFQSPDRKLASRENIQIVRSVPGKYAKISHHDFEEFASFWQSQSLSLGSLALFITETEQITPGLIESLLKKLDRLHARWKGPEGLESFKKLVHALPETPNVYPKVLSDNFPDKNVPMEQRIEMLHRAIIERIETMQKACKRAQISLRDEG